MNNLVFSVIHSGERQDVFASQKLLLRMALADYSTPFTISSTTAGSNSVEVSPKLFNSPSATLRSMRRIIFPERVLGSPDTN
jgi:hypothetical protein